MTRRIRLDSRWKDSPRKSKQFYFGFPRRASERMAQSRSALRNSVGDTKIKSSIVGWASLRQGWEKRSPRVSSDPCLYFTALPALSPPPLGVTLETIIARDRQRDSEIVARRIIAENNCSMTSWRDMDRRKRNNLHFLSSFINVDQKKQYL